MLAYVSTNSVQTKLLHMKATSFWYFSILACQCVGRAPLGLWEEISWRQATGGQPTPKIPTSGWAGEKCIQGKSPAISDVTWYRHDIGLVLVCCSLHSTMLRTCITNCISVLRDPGFSWGKYADPPHDAHCSSPRVSLPLSQLNQSMTWLPGLG